MNRRHAVKNIVLASGSLISLPYWMTGCGSPGTATHLSSFSLDEQEILASITDAILPAGEPGKRGSTGALSVEVDKFLQKLIDDCFEADVQQNVKKQFQVLEKSARDKYGNSFPGCSLAQRQELLLSFSGSAETTEKDFFNLMKTETIRGFNTSKEVMQNYFGYQVAPGYYHGCIDVKTPAYARQ